LCCEGDARLAFHAEAAGDAAAVLRYAPAAAQRAVGLGSHREAAAQFERALRFARLLLDGDPAEAAQAWTCLGCTYDAAMALADAPDEAALREALDILTSLGARPAARIVRQRLRSLGARPSRSARAQPPEHTRTRNVPTARPAG